MKRRRKTRRPIREDPTSGKRKNIRSPKQKGIKTSTGVIEKNELKAQLFSAQNPFVILHDSPGIRFYHFFKPEHV